MVRRRGHDLAFHPALQQGILHLGGDQGYLGDGPSGGQLPAGVVRHPDIADLAAAHRVGHRGQRLLQRHGRIPGVQLPEVDVVGAQPAQ